MGRTAHEYDKARFVASLDASMADWAAHGRPIVELDENLTAAFLLSDPPAVLGETDDGRSISIVDGLPPLPAFVLRFAFPCEGAYGALWSEDEYSLTPLPEIFFVQSNVEADLGKGFSYGTVFSGFLRYYQTIDRLPPPERRRAYTRRQRQEIRPAIYRLTSTLKLDRRLIEAARHYGDPEYEIRARFIVRGHWRRQACGPNHSERRLTWVAPFWKGEDALEPIQHIYKAA